jgi:Mg2+ and Co2+ transporter CorA
MNLKGLPWVDSPHGVTIVSGVMAATTVVLLIILRLMRWF